MEDESSNLSSFDIYSDLLLEQHQTSSVHVSVEQLEKTNAEYEIKLKELTQQLESLQNQNAAVLKENKILRTNISQLFRTAQAELQRKDRLLEEPGQRGPRYRQQIDYKSSINDRLRNLRKHPGAQPRNFNGIEQDFSRHVSDRQDGVLGRSDNAEKPFDQAQTTASSRKGRSHQVECGALKDIAVKEEIGDCYDKQNYKTDLAKNTEELRKQLNSQCNSDESCGKHGNNIYPEKIPNRQSMSSYKIPKKLKNGHGSSVSVREASEDGRNTDPGVSCKTTKDDTRSDQKSVVSPVRSTREEDALQGKSSYSPSQRKSIRSCSKSQKRPSRYLDRSAVRPGLEQRSGRKRRHSSEERLSCYHSSHNNATRKKHRGELFAKSTDKQYKDSSSEKSKLQKPRNDASPGKKELARVRNRRRHSSRTSSHQKTRDKVAQSAETDYGNRKRHQSDRKNKSLRRAKETLHRLHSTPKKHKKHEKHEYNYRKPHSSQRNGREADDGKTSSTTKKEVIKDLEEGEMPDSDFEDTSAISGGKSVEDDINKVIKFSEPEKQLTSDTNTNQCGKIRNNLGSQSSLNDDCCYSNRNAVEADGFKIEDNVSVGIETQSKDLLTLRLPDTAACGYCSEHETILVCAPSSQDGDPKSESDTESTSYSKSATASPDTVFKGKTDRHWLVADCGNRLLQGQNLNPEEDVRVASRDSCRLRIDNIQLQAEDVIITSEPKQGEVHFHSETDQTESISKSQYSSRTVPNALLKPTLSPFGNTSDSFSERILEVFGSNSFLESDDVEGSREDLASLKNHKDSSAQMNDSKPCSLQGYTGGGSKDSVSANENQSKQASFSKSSLDFFDSSCIARNDMTDDTDYINVMHSTESNSAGTEMPSSCVKDNQVSEEKHKEGKLPCWDTLKEEHGSQEFHPKSNESKLNVIALEQDNSSCEMEIGNSNLECTTYSADASSTPCVVTFTSCQTEAIEKNIANYDVDSDKNPKHQTETKFAETWANYLHIPETENVADLSINPSSFDALSCSASPVHDLLGDSDNSCHSNHDENNIQENPEYRDEQDACSETPDRQQHCTASESTNLSEGEIISESDSEHGSELKASTQKLEDGDRKLKPLRHKSSRNTSRSRDRERRQSRNIKQSSHKDKSHTIKHRRDKREEDRERAEFFKKKMRILEERRKAQDEAERKLSSYPGSRTKRDRSHDTHSVSRSRVGNKDKHQEKTLRSIVCKETHGLDNDQRRRVDRPSDDRRHIGKVRSSTRHDTERHGGTKRKPERAKGKETERSKRGDHQR